MSSRDIIKIIKVCADTGVENLKMGELEISFLDKHASVHQNLASDNKIIEPMTASEVEDKTYGTLTEEEEEELLIFSDPEKWEKRVIATQTEEAFHISTSPTL